MRTIIAGSRGITSYLRVRLAIERSLWEEQITEVVCGMAIGVDLLGRRWAQERGIAVKEMPVTDADWKTLGKKAGHLRNRDMAQYAAEVDGSALILVWDGKSPGSQSMLSEARLARLKIYAPCPDCEGTGHNPSRPFTRCERCIGRGNLASLRHPFSKA